MAHILVFFDDSSIRQMIAEMCELEGHCVTRAATVEDTLMILRTSLHPMIVTAERDHSSVHPDGPFFVTIRDNPRYYAQHRYIAVHWWTLTEEEEALMRELNVPLLPSPFTFEQLNQLIEEAVTSLTVRTSDRT